MSFTDRVVILVDMDCFYCQVEEKLDPSLAGKPIAVVQYNAWRGGGIIAVNYPARDSGVTRHMRGDEAKKKCPEIILARVPEVRGKADLTKYREAGKEVAEVLKSFTPLLERASVDEAYLDITDVVRKRLDSDFKRITVENMRNSYVVGWKTEDFLYNVHQNKEFSLDHCKLAMGGLIAEEIRAEVLRKTGYKCSAGIAHNKILAKLVCGLHKPNKQTILPHESVPELYKDLPIGKVNSLGGKFGNTLSEKLNITKMGELIQFSEKQLADRFDGKTANWLYNIARGIDLEPVTLRLISKSIGCSKKFPGRGALISPKSVAHWINELASEITKRLQKDLEENNRKAKQILISFAQEINAKDISGSRTIPLPAYDQVKIAQNSLDIIRKQCLRTDGTYKIKFLGISVGNFDEIKKNVNIRTFFTNASNSSKSEKCPVYMDKSVDISQSNKSSFPKNNTTFQPSSLKDDNKPSEDETNSTDNTFDDGSASVYSASTEDLNEDVQNLIYYEDVYPELVASQPILEKKYPDHSVSQDTWNTQDYKTTETLPDILNSNNETVSERSSVDSFFTKYFQNSTFDGNEAQPVSRDFDTSKILEENDLRSSDENVSSDEALPGQLADEITDDFNLDDGFPSTAKISDSRENCPECNKKILSWELQSHMDYHYALKIVQTEAHLYTTKPGTSKIEKEFENRGGSKKRKAVKDELKDTKPILAFFRKYELNDEDSTVCPECNKPIKLEELESHTDYHTAKKLHSEINSCKSSTQNTTVTSKCNSKSRGKSKNVKTTKNISSFFKIS